MVGESLIFYARQFQWLMLLVWSPQRRALADSVLDAENEQRRSLMT